MQSDTLILGIPEVATFGRNKNEKQPLFDKKSLKKHCYFSWSWVSNIFNNKNIIVIVIFKWNYEIISNSICLSQWIGDKYKKIALERPHALKSHLHSWWRLHYVFPVLLVIHCFLKCFLKIIYIQIIYDIFLNKQKLRSYI